MTLNEIWAMNDADDLIIALSDYVAEKCSYGDNMDVLSAPERVFYIAQTLELEVNNGGFSQFFYNSGGDFAAELPDALNAIGAAATAEICRRALAAFGRELPADREERLALLDEMESDDLDAALCECDDAFYAHEDDLTALNYAYVMKHQALFT